MNRLTAYIKNKAAELKAKNREKRVNIALEAARTNAEGDKLQAQLKLEETLEGLEEGNAEDIIQKLAEQFVAIEDAEYTLKMLDKVDNYLKEEVKDK